MECFDCSQIMFGTRKRPRNPAIKEGHGSVPSSREAGKRRHRPRYFLHRLHQEEIGCHSTLSPIFHSAESPKAPALVRHGLGKGCKGDLGAGKPSKSCSKGGFVQHASIATVHQATGDTFQSVSAPSPAEAKDIGPKR